MKDYWLIHGKDTACIPLLYVLTELISHNKRAFPCDISYFPVVELVSVTFHLSHNGKTNLMGLGQGLQRARPAKFYFVLFILCVILL